MGSNRTDARLPRVSLKPGPWRLADQGSEELGYLVVAGLLLRRVTVAAGRSVELLGPGDLLLPWREESASFSDADWEVAEPTRLEVWDLRSASRLSHSPTFAAEIATRSIDRARALALQSAIMSIVGIEDRLLALFWAFAERWGEMSADRAEVEVNVPQGVLAEMVGTRRPTANLALGNLRDRGLLVEAGPRRWVLTGPPPPAPAAAGARPRNVVRSGVEALTPSELRVARMAAEGRTNRELAQILVVSPKTVETHMRHVFQKLDVSKRGHLAAALSSSDS